VATSGEIIAVKLTHGSSQMLFSDMRVVSVAILLFLIGGFIANFAQPGAPPTSTEATLLNAQLELMRQYDQRIIATVYWSLGSFITMIVVLVGFSWFTNFKVYERDRDALREGFGPGSRQRWHQPE